MDLSKVDRKELAESQATLVFGQMNEPPGPVRGCPVRTDRCRVFP